jgi:hypothetical protein
LASGAAPFVPSFALPFTERMPLTLKEIMRILGWDSFDLVRRQGAGRQIFNG